MKKLAVIAAILLLLCASAAFAVECIDSDKGPESKSHPEPYIAEKGSVSYGLSEKFDECVSNEEGYHKDPSNWVREYYCKDTPDGAQRAYFDIDCAKYGYTGCAGGKCIGKNATQTTTRVVETGPKCGNHKVDPGEQCDPPDKICYDTSGNIGICTRANAQGYGGCQCKVYKGAEKTEEQVQNVTVQQNATPPAAPKEEPPAQPKEEPEEAPKAEPPAVPEERAPLPTEFENSKGIGVTRGITNAVRRFFRWIWGWFD